MKNKFPWYIDPSIDEINEAWSCGILTVDANVLLDLYRYHKITRQSIMESIENYSGDKWISYQTADEFLRNRRAVIANSKRYFENASKLISPLTSYVADTRQKLKDNRLLGDEIMQKLINDINSIIKDYESTIENTKNEYYGFVENDEILKRVMSIFGVGDDFSEEHKLLALEEGKRRVENKIPPGYMDVDKGGERPYGDYYMWLQILNKSKADKKPIVLITSEEKEDWWYITSGLTIGQDKSL